MDILSFIKSVVSPDQAQVLLYLVASNLILGTIAAIRQGEFELARLMDFGKRVIIIFGTYLAVAIASIAIADWSIFREVAWIALITFLGTRIINNFNDITGVPLPESVNKWIARKKC